MTPEEINRRLDDIERTLNFIVRSDRYLFQRDIEMGDIANIRFNGKIGTKIGTDTTQKFAFHNSTPVVQRSGSAQAAVATTASTQTTPYGYSTQAQADGIVVLVNEIRAALVEKGLLKGSA